MTRNILSWCIFALVSIAVQGKTIKNDIHKVISPSMMSMNDVQIGLSDKGKKRSSRNEYSRHAKKVLHSQRENEGENENHIDADEVQFISDIDDKVFATSGGVGEALRQVWQSFAKKIGVLDERVNLVEHQTSDILKRLAVVDCSTLPQGSKTGIYTLYLDHRGTHSVRSICDQDTEGGGWTVILNRVPHEIAERAMNFNRSMRDYKVGFGDPEGDFWVGLENIHLWTSFRNFQLRIKLEDFNGDTAFAHYDKCYVEDERNGYRLQVSGYRGNAGDSLSNLGNSDNFTAAGMMFSTHDEDRDASHEINCSQYWNIGGWWFNRCSWANLMGPYRLPNTGDGIGINWHKWRNKEYIKAATMMIRPSTQ